MATTHSTTTFSATTRDLIDSMKCTQISAYVAASVNGRASFSVMRTRYLHLNWGRISTCRGVNISPYSAHSKNLSSVAIRDKQTLINRKISWSIGAAIRGEWLLTRQPHLLRQMCPRKYGGLATQGSLFYVPFILQQKSKSIDWLSVAMFFPVEDSCLLEERLSISFSFLLFHREKGSKYYTARSIESNP